MTPEPISSINPTSPVRRLPTVKSNSGPEVISASKSKCATAGRWRLLSFKQLPRWLQDNEYLLDGHRPQLNFNDCAKSIFRLHSETGNIWTHLLGALFFLGLAIELYTFSGWNMPLMDKIMFGVYFAAAVGCLSFSTMYHTFSCHSIPVATVCQAFDYTGIAIMITGSVMPCVYYGFYCDKIAQMIYLSVFPLAGLGVAVVMLLPKLGRPEYRAIRTSVFIAFGLSGIFPYMHYCFLSDEVLPVPYSKGFIMIGFYIGGACIYANRIPEKFKPGYCDYWFQSHQIFHVCVVIAAFTHYLNIHEIASYRGYGNFECPLTAGGLGIPPSL